MASQVQTYSEYTIPIFFDNRNGDMILTDSKVFFDGVSSISNEVQNDQLLKIRREISMNKNFLCGHCKRPIYISGRYKPKFGQKRLHFQHYKCEEDDTCIFHEGLRYTQDEIRRIIFNGHQESREHKELKKFIQDCFIPIVGSEHVLVEPTLRGNDGGWRRPDLYVEMPDKNIVFEIQLTYIFLSVINERNMVHRNNGRFVIWIFKDFGDEKGETLESERLNKLDIFAANNFNAFVLDEEARNRTISKGELYLAVYYRDYYNENGQINAKLGKVLISFNDLIFDRERNLIYYFDSERKYKECEDELETQKKLIQEEEFNREQERFRLEREKQELEKVLRRKEEERLAAEAEELKLKRWKSFGIINRLFSPQRLSDNEMQSIINTAKSDSVFFQQAMQHIYSFTANHRRDNNSLFSSYYQNSIDFLTDLYGEFASKGQPNVMTCLKRCWENIAFICQYPGGKDYTVDALFSPSLSNLNFHFFDFIFSPNHRLLPEQRKQIQDWLTLYHNSPKAGKIGKDRYKHFYSWMVLLNDKVKTHSTLSLSSAQKLMKEKYKVIRGIISMRFGFLSGYNGDYKSLTDVVESFKNKYPEYAGTCCMIIPKAKRNSYHYLELFQVAKNTAQNNELDELMKILFNINPD